MMKSSLRVAELSKQPPAFSVASLALRRRPNLQRVVLTA
jgi:hypothetical protein